MTKQQMVLTGIGSVCIVILSIGSFLVASDFYEQRAVAERQQEVVETQKEKDALFEPIISTKGYGCTLTPSDVGRSGKQISFSIESANPEVTANAILSISQQLQGSVVTTNGYSYQDTIPVNTSSNRYLQGGVPTERADSFVTAVEKLHTGTTYIVSRNTTSSSAQQMLDDCSYDLATIQSLELKEAAYLAQLKQGGLDQKLIDELVNGLLQARTNYSSIIRSGRLDIAHKLNFADVYINVALSKG